MKAKPAQEGANKSSFSESRQPWISEKVVCLLWLVPAAVVLAFAWNCWPVLEDDAIDFIPPAVTYASQGALVNEVNPLWAQVDPAGEGRLVYHGFLYTLVVGKMAASATYPSVVWVMALIDVLALGACAFVLYRVATLRAGSFDFWRMALVALGVGGIASALISLRGRPEPFAMLLVALAAGCMFMLEWRWHFILAGGALGLMAASHPTGTLLCAPVVMVYASARCGPSQWLAWLCKALVVSLVFFGITMIWYPYHLSEWVAGLVRHASIVSAWDRRGRVLQYWLTVPRTALFVPLYLVSLTCGLWLSWRFRDKIRFRVGFGLSLVVFMLAAYFFNMRNPEMNYDFILAPLIYGVLILGWGVWLACDAKACLPGCRKLMLFLPLTAMAVTNLGFLRQAALYPFFLNHGMKYLQARARLQEIRESWPGKIELDGGLFTLTEDYHNLAFTIDGPRQAPLAVVQQVNRGLLSPPKLENYELVEDHFSRVVPSLFGVRIGNTVGGYNFAVYRRADCQKRQNTQD